MSKIAIVGAGMMGTATAYPLSDNGHDIRLVGTHLDSEIISSCLEREYHPRLRRDLPTGVKPYFLDQIEEALDGVEIIVSGVNSHGVHWIGQTLAPHLKSGQIIIAVTKGLEAGPDGHLLLLTDVLANELPQSTREQVSLAAIGGPCIAGELAGRRETVVIFGSTNSECLETLANAFRTPYYHIWKTNDITGLEVCVALKNAYTLGVGYAAGVLEKQGGLDCAGARMYNLEAAAFAQGCLEMEHLTRIMGGTSAFAYGPPGAGDYYVTTQGGRSVELGKLLGKGHTYQEARLIMAGETLEAAAIVQQMGKAIPAMTANGIISETDFPLMRHLVRLVVDNERLEMPLDTFYNYLNPDIWQ